MNHNLGLPKSKPLPSPASSRRAAISALKASSLFIYQARIKAAEKEYLAVQEQIRNM